MAHRPRETLVVEVVRTPTGRGKPTGQLSAVHPIDLLASSISSLVHRSGLDPALIDDVIAGCVSQVGEQGSNVGRTAALASGLPVSVPGTTIDRKCGSSLQAVHFAVQGIIAGEYDVAIACGVESMSRVKMFSALQGADPLGERFRRRFPEGLVHQGIAAELIAARYELTRQDLDEFAARSHALLSTAREDGRLSAEIVPVEIGGISVFDDEGLRPGTRPEDLGKLAPTYVDDKMSRRFPEIEWVIHAGNSSQLADGAASALLVERQQADALQLSPLAIIRATAVVGSDPLLMLTGVIPATRRALERAGLALSDIDLFEVNEAYASVPLAWAKELGVDTGRLNVNGGSIANGHPLGATGVKLLASLVHELRRRGGRYGLLTVCEAGGMANALIVETVYE